MRNAFLSIEYLLIFLISTVGISISYFYYSSLSNAISSEINYNSDLKEFEDFINSINRISHLGGGSNEILDLNIHGTLICTANTVIYKSQKKCQEKTITESNQITFMNLNINFTVVGNTIVINNKSYTYPGLIPLNGFLGIFVKSADEATNTITYVPMGKEKDAFVGCLEGFLSKAYYNEILNCNFICSGRCKVEVAKSNESVIIRFT